MGRASRAAGREGEGGEREEGGERRKEERGKKKEARVEIGRYRVPDSQKTEDRRQTDRQTQTEEEKNSGEKQNRKHTHTHTRTQAEMEARGDAGLSNRPAKRRASAKPPRARPSGIAGGGGRGGKGGVRCCLGDGGWGDGGIYIHIHHIHIHTHTHINSKGHSTLYSAQEREGRGTRSMAGEPETVSCQK